MSYTNNLKNYVSAVGLFAVLALSSVLAQPSYGQVTGATLSGTVTDASGATVPMAKAEVRKLDTNVTRTVTTDSAGLYSAPNLEPGSYSVTFSASGFANQVQSGITLAVGAQQVLNITLKVGGATQTVEVTAEAPTVDLSSAAMSGEVGATAVRELPLNGRDWTALATLEPGVVPVRAQAPNGSVAARGNRGFGNALSDAGHRPTEDAYRVNGINVNDYGNEGPASVIGVALGVDAIGEFSVLLTNFSAEYGRTSGAVINAITKSGTNQFHGSGYYFLRDQSLDARNFFDPPQIPPFRRNQYGASAGGPIKKNKAFIFGDYERITQSQSLSFRDIVPTMAARAGNLCSVPTTGTCTPNTVTVNSAVVPYLGFWPMPNSGLTPTGNGDTGFFEGSAVAALDENYATVRADYTISAKDSLAASWYIDHAPLSQPDPLLISITDTTSLREMIGLEETHVFDPSFTNAVRVGYNRTRAQLGLPVQSLNPLGSDHSLGVLPGLYSPSITGTSLTNMTGEFFGGNSTRIGYNSFQYYDDAFLVRGAHSLKFGFAAERLQDNITSNVVGKSNGSFAFSGLKNFLTNVPQSIGPANLLSNIEAAERQTFFGLYLQDDWRVRSNLTLNLGVRYQPVRLSTDANNNLGVLTNFANGVTVPVQHPWPTNQSLRNVSPQFGFSWDPFHDGKTAVRGGFGIFDVLPILPQWGISATLTYPFSLGAGTVTNPPAGSFPAGAATFVAANPLTRSNRFFEQNPHRNYAMNWNLNIQRQITSSLTATVGYVASHTVHQSDYADDSNIVQPTLTSAGYLWPFPVGSGHVLNPNSGQIRAIFWDGSARYESLQAQLVKRMSHGVQAQVSYTWGKCIDFGSSAAVPDPFQNSMTSLMYFNRQSRYGLCDYNIAQNLVLNYVWNLPQPKFGGAAVEHILGGWEVGGLLSVSSGEPTSVTIAGDPLGQKGADPSDDYPDRVPGPACKNPVTGNVNSYFKLSCFTPPVAPASFAAMCKPAAASIAATIPNTCMNLFGNAGRNTIIGPGFVNFDASLFKNIPITRISEAFNVQLRAEFFNVFNHPNFLVPNLGQGNSVIMNADGTPIGGAGAIASTANSSRQIQFGFKVIW